MICRLMGEKNCNLFRKEWVPIMHAVVEEGKILNWANLLAEVMQKTLRKYLEAPTEAKPPFYMSAYLLDMAMAQINFPDIGLSWVGNPIPIHELFFMLWADNYIPNIYTICDKIITRVHAVLFGQVPRRISPEAALTIKHLGHWYLEEFFTIIRIAGKEEISYLPCFVPDRLALREIAQQTVGVGTFARLARHGKRTWPTFPISIGKLTLANRKHVAKEVQELAELRLCKAPHHFFDLNNEVRSIFVNFSLYCPEHQPDPKEEKFQDIFNYLERFR